MFVLAVTYAYTRVIDDDPRERGRAIGKERLYACRADDVYIPGRYVVPVTLIQPKWRVISVRVNRVCYSEISFFALARVYMYV